MDENQVNNTYLKEILNYDDKTGIFTWNIKKRGIKRCIAGGIQKGYIRITIHGKSYPAHHLAWLYMTGEWPKNQIDHINNNKSDNCWENLRQADIRLNQENLRNAQKNNACGLLGVVKEKGNQKNPWKAGIRVNNRRIHLGMFSTPEEAHMAYVYAKRILHNGCTI